jgi:glycosyltransferase involved in cell wall biosynthesis
VKLARAPRAAIRRAGHVGRRAAAVAGAELDVLRSRRDRADLALFHEFTPPPTGGGHQFLRALLGELARRGLEVELNTLSGETPACLFNSFNFDFRRLRRFAGRGARMVHRVDGPIGAYRGHDDGTDRRIASLNAALADATIVQSRFSLEKHLELGYELRSPVVIPNAPDPGVFYPPESRPPLGERRMRLFASSWSDNPRKGFDVLSTLDRTLDTDRYEVVFAGRTPVRFERIHAVGALPTDRLAELLRTQDAYLAASLDDPCSNALLEALASGLPAVFRRSGGHPELVGEGGLGFDDAEELPEVLDRLTRELELRREAIRVPSLFDVTDRYLEVLRA